MTARMKNPALVLPEAMDGIRSLYQAMSRGGVPQQTLELVHLRVSQINGCSACVHAGVAGARKAGVSQERLDGVAAWRETRWFTAAERAALALAEAATRLADRPEPVPDAVFDEAAAHYDEAGLAAVTLMIATTNFFNRLNTVIREPAGADWA